MGVLPTALTPVGGEGQPGQRDVRWTAMEQEQAIQGADLGHDVRTMDPNRAAPLSVTPDGTQFHLKGLAAGALDGEVLLAHRRGAPHDLDIVLGLPTITERGGVAGRRSAPDEGRDRSGEVERIDGL